MISSTNQKPDTQNNDGFDLSFIEGRLERNETGDAELLAYLFKDKICYSVEEKTWFIWNSWHWEEDKKQPVRNLVANEVAEMYMWAAQENLALADPRLGEDDPHYVRMQELSKRVFALRGATKITTVLKRAADHPDLLTTADDWQVSAWDLPVNNGIVNLKDGSFRESKPEDYIRCPCPVEWLGLDHPAPQFEKFISDIFDGNEDIVKSMQRILGYALVGEQKESIMPILVGEGRNGKDTLFKALQNVLGELAGPVGEEIMVSSRNNSAASNIASTLRFKRIAYVSETKDSAYLDNGRVKQLTGGGKIQAKELYKDPISFEQQHTLFLMTNHKPRISAEDEAIWRRILLIEFPLKFIDNPLQDCERKADKYLFDKLKTESSGVLAWLVRGCLDWQEQGLNPCKAILDATMEYRDSEDLIGQFIEDTMTVKSDAKISLSLFYKYYEEWASINGLRPLSKIRLGKRIGSRFRKEKLTIDGKQEWYWLGVETKPANLPDGQLTWEELNEINKGNEIK